MNTLEVTESAAKLKLLLPECDEAQQLLFKRMYSHKNLELSISEVVDNMKPEQLKTALRQVEATIEKNLAKLLQSKQPGYSIGEKCNREDCTGIIDEYHSDGCCSCHINPPCGYCTESREYCPVCGWDAKQEQDESQRSYTTYKGFGSKEMHDSYYAQKAKQDEFNKHFQDMYSGKEPVNKVITIRELHTHFSMIIKGVFPKGTTREELHEKHGVRGTFGGRWESFTDHSFKFIAYTD